MDTLYKMQYEVNINCQKIIKPSWLISGLIKCFQRDVLRNMQICSILYNSRGLECLKKIIYEFDLNL